MTALQLTLGSRAQLQQNLMQNLQLLATNCQQYQSFRDIINSCSHLRLSMIITFIYLNVIGLFLFRARALRELNKFIIPLPPTNTRLYFRSYLAEQNVSIVAEVGVQKGWFSEIVLQAAPTITKYYLVDIWREQKFYDDGANYNNSIQEDIFKEALSRVSPYKSKIEIFRMYSAQAATWLKKSISDPATGQFQPILDFLYLDARHDYCGCLEDIVAWWPLLKPGGLMSGHDFMWHHDNEWNLCSNGTRVAGGVRAAVMDWATENDFQVLVTQRDRYETWSVRKPIVRPGYNLYVKPIRQVPKAVFMGEAIQTLDPHFNTMVEFNPGTGYFLNEFLWRWSNCKHFFAVDTRPADHIETKADKNVMGYLLRRIESWSDRVKLMRTSSELAAQEIAKNLTIATGTGMIDIVYISGRNDHCSTANDIKIWWPLIKAGGIIGGHGYHWLDKAYTKCVDEHGVEQTGGVRTAVLKWAVENDLQIVMLALSTDKSWWVRKPVVID